MIIQTTLKYYDTNGHNFGIEPPIPNRSLVKSVSVQMPNDREARILDAIESYRTPIRPTLRSKHIDSWLRQNAEVGDVFNATLKISDSGEEHDYYNISKIIIIMNLIKIHTHANLSKMR